MEGEVNFYAISSVYDPQNPENLIDAPEDLVTWLREHPRLNVASERPLTAGNRQATVLDVRPTSLVQHPRCQAPCVPVFPSSPYALAVEGDSREITIVEGTARPIVINVYTEEPEFKPHAKALLKSLRFG